MPPSSWSLSTSPWMWSRNMAKRTRVVPGTADGVKPAGLAPPVPASVVVDAPPVAKVQAAQGEGRIRLAIAPWGEVRVDGRKLGVSPPLNEIRLPAGKHTIEIRNGRFAPHRQTVDLADNDSLRIKHKFE